MSVLYCMPVCQQKSNLCQIAASIGQVKKTLALISYHSTCNHQLFVRLHAFWSMLEGANLHDPGILYILNPHPIDVYDKLQALFEMHI